MIFKYDPGRLDEYCKKGIFVSFRLLIFSTRNKNGTDKNNIYIMINRINKIRILNYIENIEELKNCLSNISTVEQYNVKYNILQLLLYSQQYIQ